jgi:hypothetical protein
MCKKHSDQNTPVIKSINVQDSKGNFLNYNLFINI